jgi:hypothetical protein
MPGFGDVNTPADQLIWRQLIEKEKQGARNAPKSGFSVHGAVRREEVPAMFKPGHIDPSKARLNTKGFDPKAYGWDPQGDMATEFRRCRKRATAPPTSRFLFPETTAQENGWCQKPPKPRRDPRVKLPPADLKSKAEAFSSHVPADVEGEAAKRHSRQKDQPETVGEKPWKEKLRQLLSDDAEPKRSLGKWASDSQLPVPVPSRVSAAAPAAAKSSHLSAAAPAAVSSHLSAAAPAALLSQLSAAAPSNLSTAMLTELSRTSSWPGVPKDLVRRAHMQDDAVAKAMVEFRRYSNQGDRGHKHFYPLGETDATAYANAFTKCTMGVPPHKWDPRAL